MQRILNQSCLYSCSQRIYFMKKKIFHIIRDTSYIMISMDYQEARILKRKTYYKICWKWTRPISHVWMECTTRSPNIHACIFFFFYGPAATKFTQPNEQSVGKIRNRSTACDARAMRFFFHSRSPYYARDARIDAIPKSNRTLNPPRSTEMRIHLALRPTALFPARLRYF